MRPQRRESKRLSSPYPPPLSRPPSRSRSLSGAYGRPNARRDAVDAGQEVALGGALLVALRPLKLRLVELVCDNSMCSLLSMSRQRILFAESFPARSQNCSLAVKSKPNKPLRAHAQLRARRALTSSFIETGGKGIEKSRRSVSQCFFVSRERVIPSKSTLDD